MRISRLSLIFGKLKINDDDSREPASFIFNWHFNIISVFMTKQAVGPPARNEKTIPGNQQFMKKRFPGINN